MFYLRNLSGVALFAVLLVGCGGSGGGGGAVPVDPGGNGDVGHPGLQGAWQSDCFILPVEDGPNEGQRLNYLFEGDKVTQVVDVFEDPQCQGEPYFHPKLIWRYTIGTTFTSSDGVDATKIDFRLIDQTPSGIAEADREYDIFAFNITSDELYFGLDGSTLNEASRPTRLNFDFPMRRQP